MTRFLCLGLIGATLALSPTLLAQQQIAAAPSNVAAAVRGPSRVAPRADVYSTTIQGNALTSTNGQLVDSYVRLRDARYGRVIDTQLTDKSGLFAFRNVDPGSYIVELMSSDQAAVLAASQLLNVNAGEVMSAVVKLPFRLPPFAGLLGGNAAAVSPVSATAVMAQAAANSVLIAVSPLTAVPACPEQVF